MSQEIPKPSLARKLYLAAVLTPSTSPELVDKCRAQTLTNKGSTGEMT